MKNTEIQPATTLCMEDDCDHPQEWQSDDGYPFCLQHGYDVYVAECEFDGYTPELFEKWVEVGKPHGPYPSGNSVRKPVCEGCDSPATDLHYCGKYVYDVCRDCFDLPCNVAIRAHVDLHPRAGEDGSVPDSAIEAYVITERAWGNPNSESVLSAAIRESIAEWL